VALSETSLIERYFRSGGAQRPDVALGIGDDAAILSPPAGSDLIATTDTLVAGVHFLSGAPPAAIGHRALAVNLSDLAAMGARPAWALLALTLPEAREAWLAEFAAGLGALAREHRVALVGGDTTRGPLCVTVQLLGFAPPGRALRRGGARAGDVLFVSGSPGDAAAGLALEQQRLTVPAAARDYASACIDVSDGLLGDAGKLAQASAVAVEICFEELPISEELEAALGDEGARQLALSGGDDYELCFAVAPARVPELLAQLPPERWGYTRIGALLPGSGARVVRGGTVMEFSHSGYQHFS